MLDEKDLQALDALISRRLGVMMESDIAPKFDLLYEKLDMVDEKLSQLPTAEDMTIANGRIDILEAIVKKLSREVNELKRAQ